jgi:DNA-binding NarL/FixJ family response regulator
MAGLGLELDGIVRLKRCVARIPPTFRRDEWNRAQRHEICHRDGYRRTERVAGELMTKRCESPRIGLTGSEQRVFARLLRGESNKEVAQNLGCTVKNVEYHVSNILRRAQAPTMKKLLAELVGTL